MNKLEEKEIRHQFDPVSGVLYISIVDVIKILDLSTDPRNYWKTLKNRLKNTHLELVTNCNQLKMRASDGKMYLTDTTDSDTCLLLIQQIAPKKIGEFRKLFKSIDGNEKILEDKRFELSTEEKETHKIKVDVYKKNDTFIVKALIAGVEKEDIFIVANYKNILIKSKTKPPANTNEDDYITSELYFGKFSREINLPEEIEIEKIETNYSHGLLEIVIPVLDKSHTRIIKVK